MNEHEITLEQHLTRLAEVAKTMTQEQVAACAWVMGASNCGWNPENVSKNILYDIPPES